MAFRDFGKLRIYRFAQGAAVEAHVAFKDLPPNQEVSPGLLAEMSTATHQVCAKIGAAHTHRQDLDLCVDLLSRAKTKAAETLVFLDLLEHMGCMTKEQKRPLTRKYDQLLRRLDRLIEIRKPYDDYFEGKNFSDDDDDD